MEGNRVIQGSPWTFNKHLLALTKYDGDFPLGQVVFDQCDFWVQAFNLPLNKKHRDIAEIIANHLGRFVAVDTDDDGIA